MPRSSSRWRLIIYKKKRRNLYLLPSYVSRLLALPFRCRTATQKPTFIFNIQTSANICKQ